MKILTINGITIPQRDIINISSSDESVEFNGSALIASKIDITLVNTNYDYDERVTGTIFSQVNYFNWDVVIYDDEIEMTTWQGRLKEYSLEDKSRTVKIVSSDYIRDIVDTNCVAIYSGITPAEVIYNILTDSTGLNIPASKIIIGGFDEAKALQASQTITTNYNSSDNVKCIDVIRTLCKYTSCFMYTVNNLIVMYQDRAYSGEIGTPITNGDILPGSYKQWGDDSQLLNAYNVAYKSGANVARTLGADPDSKLRYGKTSSFILPESGDDSTLAADLRIIFETKAGADEVGELALSLYKDRLIICSMDLDWHMNFIQLNDILDMKFFPFVNEPIRVKKIKRDDKNKKINIEGVLLNYYRYVTLDTTPPESIEFLSAMASNESVYLTWTKSAAPDLVGYKIYFTRTNGQWFSEEAGNFISPKVIAESVAIEINGNCRYKLTGLVNDYEYYFKISAYDTSFNESEHSEILTAIPYDDKASTMENEYCTDGDLYLGVVLASANPNSGYLVSGFTHYDDLDYDGGLYEITAVYESPLLKGSSIALLGHNCDALEDIMVCYRTHNNGSFGSWSSLVSALGSVVLVPELAEFQLRVIFKSPHWSDPDVIYIEVIE